jgi:hypothetical protein
VISLQGVKEFASRNQDEIAKTKQDLTSELAGLWVVNKQQRLADAQQDLDSVMLCRSFGQPSRRFRPRLHGSPIHPIGTRVIPARGYRRPVHTSDRRGFRGCNGRSDAPRPMAVRRDRGDYPISPHRPWAAAACPKRLVR